MPGDAANRNGGNLFRGRWIDDAEGPVTLVGDQQIRPWRIPAAPSGKRASGRKISVRLSGIRKGDFRTERFGFIMAS